MRAAGRGADRDRRSGSPACRLRPSSEDALDATACPRRVEECPRRMHENGPAGGPENDEIDHVVTDVVELVSAEVLPDCAELERSLHVGSTVAPDHGLKASEVI